MKLSSIGIIPDGNRRYAKKKNLSLVQSYQLGTAKAWELIDWISNYKEIKSGTFYTLSLENLTRSKAELSVLLKIFDKQLDAVFEKPIFEEKGIRLKFIGNLSEMPKSFIEKIRKVEEYTAPFNKKLVQLAFGYSGQEEIVNAAKRLAVAYKNGEVDIENIDENSFKDYLYSGNEPDLIIRTSGEKRLSGFLTYQSAYSELYFSEKYWPEFEKQDFDAAVKDYYKRKRNFGK